MKELWKVISNYEGRYEVSNYGRIYSNVNKKYLKPGKNSSGYLTVSLCIRGKQNSYTVHKLVAEHFMCKSNIDLVVNHVDGDKNNNRLDNLEYCTTMENNIHAKYEINTNIHNCKITYCSNGLCFKSITDAAKWVKYIKKSETSIGCIVSYIARCKLGEYNTAYGYGWK